MSTKTPLRIKIPLNITKGALKSIMSFILNLILSIKELEGPTKKAREKNID